MSVYNIMDFGAVADGKTKNTQGNRETIVRNVSFSNIEIKTSGEDAVICRNCQGVKFANVELTNRSGPIPNVK